MISVAVSVGRVRQQAIGDLVAGVDPRQLSDGRQVGTIGWRLGAMEQAGFTDALAGAERWLATEGARVVRCPVQLTTWHGHRAMTSGFPDETGVPPFPLEPVNGRWLPELLARAGYGVAHRAVSHVIPVSAWITRAGVVESRLGRHRLHDRALDGSRLDEELASIHALALAAFRPSWGFSELSLGEFMDIYRPLTRLADPTWVRILEDEAGATRGFLFAYPDPAFAPGRPGARVVLKTIAVDPLLARRVPGLGAGLTLGVYRRAAERGYSSAVHALAAEGAVVDRISAPISRVMRRYATFEKRLGME